LDNITPDNKAAPSNENNNNWFKRTFQKIATRYEQYRSRRCAETPQDKSARKASNATIATALFTFILTAVSILQGYIANNTLNELQTEQRPWVSFADEIGMVEGRTDVQYTETDISFLIKLSVRNSGNLPALYVHVEPNVVTGNGFVTKQIDFVNSLKKSAPLFGLTLFKSDTPTNFSIGITLRRDMFPPDKMWLPYVTICVVYYFAAATNPHLTCESFQLLTNGKGVIGPATRPKQVADLLLARFPLGPDYAD
jgi:hypothetical protein